jgi:cytochrome c oxidase assembly protein subunit 11
VSFFVDPAIASDPKMRGVGTITLSYTFFRSLDAKPQAGTGRTAASGVVPVPVN